MHNSSHIRLEEALTGRDKLVDMKDFVEENPYLGDTPKDRLNNHQRAIDRAAAEIIIAVREVRASNKSCPKRLQFDHTEPELVVRLRKAKKKRRRRDDEYREKNSSPAYFPSLQKAGTQSRP